MRQTIFYIILLLLGFSLTNCYKCEQNQVANLKFTQDELKINPYTGNEVLIFKNSNADSIVLPKGYRDSEISEIYKYDYETAKLDHHGCQGDYYYRETNYFSTQQNNPEAGLTIDLYFLYQLSNPTSEKLFDMFIYTKNTTFCGFSGRYQFNVDTLKNYSVYSTIPDHDSIAAFHSLFVINNKVYTNVYELHCQNKDTRFPEYYSLAYYSIKDGLVGFKTNYGTTWYLDSKY